MSIINQAWNHFDTVHQLANCSSSKIKQLECRQWTTLLETLTLGHPNPPGFDEGLQPCHGAVMESNTGEKYSIPSMNIQVCTMLDYLHWGSQTVVVGPNMQEAFADTELGKVPATHLKFPFPAYWLALPENEDIRVYGGDPETVVATSEVMGETIKTYGTGWHKVKGAYVINRKEGLLVHMWAPDPEDPEIRKRLSELANGPTKLGLSGTVGLDWAHQWFTMRFLPDQDLEDTIREVYTDINREVFDPHPNDPSRTYWQESCMGIQHEGEGRDIMVNSSCRMLRIIINSALYMTSPKADIAHIRSDKRERLLQQAQDLKEIAARNGFRKGRRKLQREAKRKTQKAERYKSPIVWIGPKVEEKMRSQKAAMQKQREHTTRKGHVRKGHWHKFLTGRKLDNHGNAVPSDARSFIFHWIPPLWCGDLEDKKDGQTYAFREV